MALLGTLCVILTALGFTHRSLRARVTQLLGSTYSANQMSYDLARLRLNGLIERRPHSNTYTLTPDGQRVALFYTKVHNRILRPLLAADKAPAPAPMRQALATIDRHVNGYIDDAKRSSVNKPVCCCLGAYRCGMAIGAEVEAGIRGKFDSLFPHLDER